MKIKASIIIYHGGWGGGMKGESHGFHEEGKTVIANRVQRGGGRGYKTLTANEGIIKILQSFGGRGGYKINFSVIQ